MRSFWKIALTSAWVCSLVAAPRGAYAQPSTLEVFAGYSYLHDPSHSVLTATARDNRVPLGWAAGVAAPAWRAISIVGDVSGHYKRKTTFADDVKLTFHTVAAGPRVSARLGPFTEFVEALAGVAIGRGSAFGTSVSATGLLLQGGGGVDYPIAGKLAVRVELDYRRITGDSQGRLPSNQFRAVAAFVIH
jgi:opacity protein-like surface antigen